MKKVGFLGAVALIFNAATGPGLPFTPQSFQSPGYVFTIFCFLLFAVVAGFSILFIIEAMQAIPANKHFQGNVEYATLINFYFEPTAHIVGQILLYGALVSNAVQGIILSAQAIDKLLIDIFGRTCGIVLSAQPGWICVTAAGDSPSPFGTNFMLFTFGLIVVLLFVIPLGMTNLDDNMWVQYLAFGMSMVMVAQWISAPFVAKLPVVTIPAATKQGKDYGSVIGTVMLNFAVTVIIPSWINMKSKEVNVQQAVWSAISAVVVFYIIPGSLLATGFEKLEGNVLTVLLRSGQPAILTKITVYLFAFIMLIPAIPVNLLISKDNLVQNKVVSDSTFF
jgi:amino acid permease